MEKAKYERPEAEVVYFDDKDILTVSDPIETPEVGGIASSFSFY